MRGFVVSERSPSKDLCAANQIGLPFRPCQAREPEQGVNALRPSYVRSGVESPKLMLLNELALARPHGKTLNGQ